MDRPTVLLVGSGERMKDALGDALERHRLMVESVSTESAVQAAFAAAPDLLVLIGDATRDGGRAVLARLGESPATATVPVVLLTDEAGLDRRLSAFKHGVVAVVPRTASADGMARVIAEIARELPERPGETAGELGEATVDELVELFSQQLRTGILSVTSGAGDGASAQVVLRAGRPVTEAIEELVDRLRPLVRGGEPRALRYEFHESTSARLTLLESDESEPEDAESLRGRRILLVEQNPARADVLVQELRAHGALVVVVDGEGAGLERARALDPEVVIIDGSGVHGWALPALRALRRDPRLRWASLLVVDAAELWPGRASGPDLARLAASVKALVRADRELAERAQKESAFDTRLEVIGPSRTLRALTQTGLGLRVSASHPRARVEIDLAEGLVAGARALGPMGRQLAEGPAALAALLMIGSGRVRIERKDAPAVANVMSPLDDALAAAAREHAPIQPSVPPPAISEPPTGGDAEPAPDTDRLIGRLEQLLERLQKVLPAAEAAAEEVEEEPTQRRTGVPKATKAIPPPKATLPTGRKATMMLGSVQAPPSASDDDEDLPEIEATAEPGVVTSAIVPKPAPLAPPTAQVPAPQAPAVQVLEPQVAAPRVAAPQVAAPQREEPRPVPRVPPPFEASIIVEPDVVAPAPAPPPAPMPARPAPAEQENVWEASAFSDADFAPPKSRGPLWFGLAFVLTLLIGGGAAAAYLYLEREREPAVQLPVAGGGVPTSPADAGGEPTPAAPAVTDAGAAPVAALDPGAQNDGAPDSGAPATEAPGAGGDAGTDAGPPPEVALEEPTDEEPTDDEEAGAEEPVDEEETGGDARSQRVRHLVRLANFQRNAGNFGDAEGNYMAVLRLDANNTRALAGLARLNMARRTNDRALRWARRLVGTAPRNAANHVLLGDVYAALGNRRAAVASWTRARELSPTLRSARQRLASQR